MDFKHGSSGVGAGRGMVCVDCAVLSCEAKKGIYLNPSDLGSRKQKDTFEILRERGRERGREKERERQRKGERRK